uniref:tRNA-synt_1 domain-containing protein n=1 Tax=Steinernema glaseri TaxID=37863 RepID=A0A1I8AUP5_9BILA
MKLVVETVPRLLPEHFVGIADLCSRPHVASLEEEDMRTKKEGEERPKHLCIHKAYPNDLIDRSKAFLTPVSQTSPILP